MQDLGDLSGGQGSFANAINNKTQVAGVAFAATGFPRAFIWSESSGMKDLGTLPGNDSSGASSVNNRGHSVGSSYCLDTTGCLHAFLWSKTKGMQDLGDLPSGFGSSAYAVNGSDRVVGYAGPYNLGGLPEGPYAFLWTKATGMSNLNELIDSSSGWSLYTATGINAKGQIAGWGTLNGEEHGFLLTPKLE